MIQITPAGVSVSAGAEQRLGAELTDTGIALLPEFLGGPVLKRLLRQVESANFITRHEVTAENVIFGTTQFVPKTEPPMETIHFVLNQPPLLSVVQAALGCVPIYNFVGRVHRTREGSGEQIGWHRDTADYRLVGLNINLGIQEFSGGVFQIRGPENRQREVKHVRAGDAFLFQIDHVWQHRLTPVESGERTVAVGWFRSGHPDTN